MPVAFWKNRDEEGISKSRKRTKGQRSIYSTAPAIQQRESSLYLPAGGGMVVVSSGRGSESGQATATIPSSVPVPKGGIRIQKPNRTLFTSIKHQHQHHHHHPQQASASAYHSYLPDHQQYRHPYSINHTSAPSDLHSLSTFDLYDRPRYTPAAAPYHSAVDIRRPTTIAFADELAWTDSSRTSSSCYNHSYDSQDEDEDEEEEESVCQKRRDIVSRARLTCQSFVSLGKTMSGALKSRGEGMKSEVWAKSHSTDCTDDMSAPPPIPARSRLRAVPGPKSNTSPIPTPIQTPTLESSTSRLLFSTPPTAIHSSEASARVVGQKKSQMFQLPVDRPLPQEESQTPVLPSPLSGTFESPNSSSRSPGANGDSILTFGKKKGGKNLEKDPYKVRDGAEKKSSSSGVYTPSTFPGASGPRPSHFPTHVYTPPTFTLHPTRPSPQPISPSGSSIHSSLSSHSDSTAPPATPLSPTTRFGKALSNVKRISTNIKGHKDIQHPQAHEHFLPPSASFESNSTTSHSRDSSLGPQTPTMSHQSYHLQSPTGGYFPPLSAGLGVGLSENVGYEGRRARSQSIDAAVLFDHGAEGGKGQLQSPSLGHKGRRKPVPRLAADGLSNDMAGLEVEETHAL
ncbi:hypothetical protein IAR55_001474 [Kwoniella newhampshirensis]|uniref:Uncharacterized protein n=1 Tax=Kwoniella newhampshirensis TaxID=1651941 RepID=A0AAW0Z279_9TREE